MRLLVRMLFALLVLSACRKEKQSTATGTGTKVLEWSRGPVMLSTGVSLGTDVGLPITDRRIITFTPTDARDSSLGIVRVEVNIDRGDVAIFANDAGDRPAESGMSPKHIVATALENHGWQITSACDATMNGPGTAQPKGVQFTQNCRILLRSGEDNGEIIVVAAGDGSHQIMASFGTVTTLH